MARPAKPWWHKQKGQWFATIKGKKVPLGTDRESAEQKFHALKAGRSVTIATDSPSQESLALLARDMILWTRENRASRTADRYQELLQPFIREFGRMEAMQLTPAVVTQWMSGQDSWNSTTKAGFVTALKRTYNWAKQHRGYSSSPIGALPKPKRLNRVITVDLELRLSSVIRYVHNQPFRDIATFCWDVGCRPQEAKNLTAKQVDLDLKRCVITESEGAKGGITRAIYMTNRARMIVQRLSQNHPTGPIFRNTRGNAWTGFAVKCAFQRVEWYSQREHDENDDDAVDIPVIKMCQYDFRHLWITRKLRSGMSTHVIAKLAGHQDTRMIDQVYSHIQDDPDFMLNQLRNTE